MLARTASLGVRDAIHAAVMLNNDVTAVATFDTAFDHVPGLSRVAL
jgi:predicted nucleic acid-binding protein